MSHGRDFSVPCDPPCKRLNGVTEANATKWFNLLGFVEPCGCAYTLALRLREDSE